MKKKHEQTQKKVATFIATHHLLRQDSRYLVALSGGADSVCLLLILRELGISVEAVHCNFKLRGDESDRDEAFCVSLCEKYQIPLHRIHFDTRIYSTIHKMSVEMAARELRYNYFSQLCEDVNADGICVAHHQDDSVETVLMNLIRGTGIHGLTGIAPISYWQPESVSDTCRQRLQVIRPLLCLSRQEIEQYLTSSGQEFVTDSTNLVPDVFRNKIRLQVIPLMKELNPSVSTSISETALRIGEAVKFFDAAITASVDAVVEWGDEAHQSGVISLERLRQQPSVEYTLFKILSTFGFNSSQVNQIFQKLDAETGTEFQSTTHQLLFSRGSMIIEPIPKPFKDMRIPEPGNYVLSSNQRLRVALSDGSQMSSDRLLEQMIEKSRRTVSQVYLDASDIQFPLMIRTIQSSDRFHPFGMRGTKLVSDYLTDRKMNLFQKRRQLVVLDATGTILWLVNERMDERFRITDSTTKVLSLECLDA